MSPLTRIFVVLLVVLEILFVSGTIVFVNRAEDYKTAVGTEKSNASRALKQYSDASAQLSAVQAQATADLQSKDQQLTAARSDLDHAQDSILKLNQQVAELQSNVATLTAGSASTAEALKLAQGRLGTQQDQLGELRSAADKAERQYTDSTIRIGDLENKLQVTEKARRTLAEQNTQMSADLERAQQHGGGTSMNTANTPQETQMALNGQILDKKTIAGVPYATISLGSADQVAKNMQFKVIDSHANRFLGYLTVDTVEPHEATGRLDGPRIGDVQKGNDVRTQL